MHAGEYVKLICNKATELSIPREWNSMNVVRQQKQLSRNTPTPTIAGRGMIEHCAVVGGGVMGQGITISLLRAGFRTTLIERDEQTLAQRMADIWQTMSDDLQKGRVSNACVTHAGQLLKGSTDFEKLRNVDFVIETVFENMALKCDVFRMLDRVCPEHTILCTNTSTLDIETLARATRRPTNVVGMHFFTPSHINPALEVIYCGETTSRDAVGTVIAMGQKLEKIPVIMQNGPGFVANRMFRPYLAETMKLLEAGYTPQEVDAAFRNFGFAVGPFQTLDIIGLDTLQRVTQENKWELSGILGLLIENGRLGRKTSRGFYLYKNNHRHHDEDVERLLDKVRTNKKRPALTQEDMVRKCVYPLVNEGFEVLNEKIVERAESIDSMWILGYGWPTSKGGPMYWAQKEGLKNILDYMKKQKREKNDYPWQPSPYLQRLVDQGINNLPVEQWATSISKL